MLAWARLYAPRARTASVALHQLKVWATLALALFASQAATAAASAASEKLRTILTTDGEVDDIDTMIRWFLHANEMEPVGLVNSGSQWH